MSRPAREVLWRPVFADEDAPAGDGGRRRRAAARDPLSRPGRAGRGGAASGPAASPSSSASRS